MTTPRIRLSGHRVAGTSMVAAAALLVLAALTATAVASAPQIEPGTKLQHAAVDIGRTNTFTVTATGEALSYQWRLDGQDLPSQTNAALTIGPAQPSDEGDYTVEVRNSEGAAVSDPVRLWVVPRATDFIKGNYTNGMLERLPYFYLLPANYDPQRSYPLFCLFHGTPGHEGMITNALPGYTGYANMPALKTMASYGQQARDPMILFWPTRRTGDSTWSDAYLRLVSGMLDQLLTEFNVDTNRIYVGGGSEGVHAAWDLIALRPGFFACAAFTAGWQGNAPVALVKDVRAWVWRAADDSPVGKTRDTVRSLRMAGANPIYTEYATGGPDPHLGGIFMGLCTPALIDWILAQRGGAPSLVEPLLSIHSPTPEAFYITSATSLSLAGSADPGSGRIDRVAWENVTSKTTGAASGTNLWSATSIPLTTDKTNLVIVTARTTSWAPAFGGNTTFNDTLTVFCSPIRVTLALQDSGALLSWAGGVAPYSVQRATNLSLGDWAEVLTNAAPPLALPLDGTAGFYRILGQ